MRILISLIIAYFVTGIARAGKDIFNPSVVDTPHWAHHPKFWMLLLVIFLWPMLAIQDNIMTARGNVARGVTYGLIGSFFQLLIIGLIVWVCLSFISYFIGLF